MEQQPLPPAPDNPVPPELPSAPQSTHRKYRWLIVCLAALLVLGVGWTGWRMGVNKKAATNSRSATNTTAPQQASSPEPAAAANDTRWKGTINPAAIPLGDGKVSSAPQVGAIDSCTTTFTGGGARHAGSWINQANATWNSQTKVAVAGSVSWPAADFSQTASGASRTLITNDLPKNYPTGIFPVSRSDPAYQYDTNPNQISAQSLRYALPLNPAAASSPGCLPLGPIGVLSDGVVLFNGLDAAGRDAVAHETQDTCSGHPNGQEMYHYHDVPSCLLSKASGAATLVGYALDGYGIYVEHDSSGNLPTNADLDACHGRISQVTWNGQLASVYHYDATLEYPYTLGCFHGTPVVSRAKQP